VLVAAGPRPPAADAQWGGFGTDRNPFTRTANGS